MLKQAPFGIIPAMVTPMTQEEEINERALRRLVNHLIEGGVHGLFAIGSQGEFWALSADEKRRVWETVVDEVHGRIPVYGGSVGVTTREAIALTRLAERSGVDAAVVLTPHFISPTDDQLCDHYKAIAESTDLPIMVYANPARSGVRISVDLLARLVRLPQIVGIKDSSGSMELTAEYVRVAPPSFSVLIGPDTLIYAGLLCGTKGAIAATANINPSLAVSIYTRFMAGDLDGARAAQRELAPLRLALAWGTFPTVMKEALNLMGMGVGPCRKPVGPLTDQKREDLRQLLLRMNILSSRTDQTV